MKQDVFTQKKVASFLSRNFVSVELDVDKDELVEGFSVVAVPTFYVLTEKGKMIDAVVGGANAKQFVDYLKSVLPKK